MRERRIGTITMGVCLVVFGVLFLVHIFGGFLNYELIFHLWPLILIGLGMEILFYTCIASGKAEKYDFAAIIVIFLLTGFSMCMAGADWVITNGPQDVWFNSTGYGF